jgi:hypothetical protein
MNSGHDNQLFRALLEHYDRHTLPRMMDIKHRLDAGEKLNDTEISFLQDVFAEIHKIEPLIHRHPEYQVLFSRIADFCKALSMQAVSNENGH